MKDCILGYSDKSLDFSNLNFARDLPACLLKSFHYLRPSIQGKKYIIPAELFHCEHNG